MVFQLCQVAKKQTKQMKVFQNLLKHFFLKKYSFEFVTWLEAARSILFEAEPNRIWQKRLNRQYYSIKRQNEAHE